MALADPTLDRLLLGSPLRRPRVARRVIVNAQHELAFRKRRVCLERGDPEVDPLVVGWRREIAEVRSRSGGERRDRALGPLRG
jgi:hypothetical protein